MKQIITVTYNEETDQVSTSIECTVPQAVGTVITILQKLAEQTGITYNEWLEDIKQIEEQGE